MDRGTLVARIRAHLVHEELEALKPLENALVRIQVLIRSDCELLQPAQEPISDSKRLSSAGVPR